MNLIKRTIDVQERKKIENLCTKSMERGPLVISHILAEFHPERVRHTQLCIITSLKWIIQISSNCFTVGFVKLLSTHPILFVVWGNFPFKVRYASSKFCKKKWTLCIDVIAPTILGVQAIALYALLICNWHISDNCVCS